MTTEKVLKIKAVMIGHAVGDALGVPVEFCSRAELQTDPMTDMRGFGSYPVPAGAWSDDTSMSLAALDSLAGGKIDWCEIIGKLHQMAVRRCLHTHGRDVRHRQNLPRCHS